MRNKNFFFFQKLAENERFRYIVFGNCMEQLVWMYLWFNNLTLHSQLSMQSTRLKHIVVGLVGGKGSLCGPIASKQ